MSEARKHHYVPVFYQQNFVNPRGLLWVYDRRLKTCKELNPRSVCFEKEFYTVKRKDAPWERRIETECFGLIDGMGSAAIRELLSGSPTHETIRGVFYFIGVQIHRTPTFAKTISEVYVASVEEMMRLMAVNVGRMAGGAPFEMVLIFRVAAPSRFEGRVARPLTLNFGCPICHAA